MTPYLELLLGVVPVWLVITPLVGVMNGALFFLLAGRRPSSLPLYIVLASVAASLAQASGLVGANEPPYSLGDVHVVAASLAAWVTLAVARAAGF